VAICAYGSTHHAVVEARHQLADHGVETDYLRIRGLPLHPAVAEFIARHDRVYVAEQNRDGQMEALLRQELPGSWRTGCGASAISMASHRRRGHQRPVAGR